MSPEQLEHREWVDRIAGSSSGEVIDLDLARIREQSNSVAAGLVGTTIESMVEALNSSDAVVVDASRLEALRQQVEQAGPVGPSTQEKAA